MSESDPDDAPDGSDSRGIMTDREREILLGKADVTEKYYNVVVTRVRRRIERLEDLELAALEAHSTLADELREAVCGTKSVPGEPATITFPCFAEKSGDYWIEVQIEVFSTPDGPEIELLWIREVGVNLSRDETRAELEGFLEDGGKAEIHTGRSRDLEYEAAVLPGWSLDADAEWTISDLRFSDVERTT